MSRKYSEILIRAKAELKDESYWKKGSFFEESQLYVYVSDNLVSRCMCGMGAAIQANRDIFIAGKSIWNENEIAFTHDYNEFRAWVNDNMRVVYPQFPSFYTFNDHPDTKFQDVINLFDILIAAAKSQGI